MLLPTYMLSLLIDVRTILASDPDASLDSVVDSAAELMRRATIPRSLPVFRYSARKNEGVQVTVTERSLYWLCLSVKSKVTCTFSKTSHAKHKPDGSTVPLLLSS